MNKETMDTLMLVGSLALFVGGPTTIAAGLATRIAIRGGMMLGRRLMAGAVSGAVATGAAFIYMTATGGGGEGGIPGDLPVPTDELRAEEITFTYTQDNGEGYFAIGDHTINLTVADVEISINAAVGIGDARTIRIVDEGDNSARDLARVRNFTQASGLEFIAGEITDEGGTSDE
jgi:hypothetical protein